MSTVSCLWCADWIESSNLRFAGYCSSPCRDADRTDRQAEHERRRQARADARDPDAADRGWRGR